MLLRWRMPKLLYKNVSYYYWFNNNKFVDNAAKSNVMLVGTKHKQKITDKITPVTLNETNIYVTVPV